MAKVDPCQVRQKYLKTPIKPRFSPKKMTRISKEPRYLGARPSSPGSGSRKATRMTKPSTAKPRGHLLKVQKRKNRPK